MPERTYEMDVAGGKEICHQIKKAGEPAPTWAAFGAQKQPLEIR
jgi:hypothetical protein